MMRTCLKNHEFKHHNTKRLSAGYFDRYKRTTT